MKTYIQMLAVLSSLIVISSTACDAAGKENSVPSAEVLRQYILIQERLAADTDSGIKEAALAISKSSASKAVRAAAKKLADAKNIKEARTSFKTLSTPIASEIQKARMPGYDVVECTMGRGGLWVQKSGTIANPYYGKEMLECGEKISSGS
jgi:hypothetical protein